MSWVTSQCLKYFRSSQIKLESIEASASFVVLSIVLVIKIKKEKRNIFNHLTTQHPATSEKQTSYNSVCALKVQIHSRLNDETRRNASFEFPREVGHEPNENKPIEENSDLPVQAWKIQEQGLPFAELKIPKAYNFVGKKPAGQFGCSRCGKSYMRKDSLQRHVHWECGKEPQFQCPFCPQPEDLSITGLKWAAAWQRWSVPSIMWRSGGGLGKGLGSGSSNPEGFNCPACGRVYKLKSSLRNHQKWECGKEPQFQCPHCVYRAKQKMHIARHMERMHKEKIYKQELV
ncbi:Longitudinals lacking protein, isoforms A/B/D/L [Anthophora quadrimaculata]